MLMHVSPNEVAGLQALAQQHGRSMTTNPETGMPEAFEFKDLIPTAAGFALDYFLPGAGQAAAGLFGLTGAGAGAIGTAGIVGGLTGLASGSFKDGLLAGVGAYGGASLAGGLGAAGSNANTLAANAAFDSSNPAMDAERVAAIQAAAKPDIGAGFKAAAANPIDFLKNNKFGVAAAALPALMSMGQSGAPTANRNPGYIRRYVKNPVTGALEQASATPVDEFGGQSAVSFGGVGQPVRYAAEGGSIGNHLVYNPTTKKYDTVDASGKPVGPVTFGGVRDSANMRDPNDARTDSQKAYDYLMGTPGAKNPMLFYHQQPGAATGALVPADLNTRTGGHYVINASGTGYDWAPDSGAGIAPLVGQGGEGGAGDQGGQKSTPNYGPAATLGAYLSDKGLTSIGGYLSQAAREGRTAQQQTPTDEQDSSRDDSRGPIGNLGGINALGSGMMAADKEGAAAPAGGGVDFSGADSSGTGFAGDVFASGGLTAFAHGGLGSLGGYSDGGRLLRGPGDGVSDSIPATIGRGRQPARLADGEFVIPARIVSELGNGSTAAGAKQLYAMMARIQAGRAKTTGKNNVAKNSKAARYLPA
jgi:hypothetical protein